MTAAARTRVLIVGGGPTGLILANLLGGQGIDTVLVERNPGCVPEPRAIALDGESLRTIQATGLVDTVLPTLRQGFVADYVNGAGVHLFSTDLSPRPYGFCLQNSFDQPTLERQLLAGLARFDCVAVHHDTELLGFTQDDDAVTATLRAGSDGTATLRADFMVGCDGGRSTVRQALGIPMVGDRLPQQWLVIDTVDTHLTGDPVCRFFCDPARPAMTLLRPGGERRWEWMLVDGETEQEMLAEDRIRSLLAAHTDPDRVRIYRKCVYRFSAVVADRFREGRVFLAGDAAHMTPPFAGQGLNAGVRDARNLSWKLDGVLQGGLPAGLLDTYDLERHDAAREMIDMAVMLGDQIQPTDPAAAAARDALFEELNSDPARAAAFGQEVLAPLFDVRLKDGWLGGDELAGRMLPQPPVGDRSRRLDDTLGTGFSALLCPGSALPAAVREHPLWRSLSPALSPLDPALASFTGGVRNTVLLVRPDRFVLTALRLDQDPVPALDGLWEALSPPGRETDRAATGSSPR